MRPEEFMECVGKGFTGGRDMMEDQTEQNKQILIVDDSAANLALLTDILSSAGYLVCQADSGALALQHVNTSLPALILIALPAPATGGYELCRSLKANPETAAIPVILISSVDDEQSKVNDLEAGAVDLISLPFRAEEVLARVSIQLRMSLLQQDLTAKNEKLEDEMARRIRAERAVESRLMALTQVLDDSSAIDFGELFNVPELQLLQDQFSDAFGVASIITRPDGTPVTQPSNFSRLCGHIIRCTSKGKLNCMHSDALIGRHHPEGPVVQPCLSGGLWDAGASITLGGRHVASWLIGQVRSEVQEEGKMEAYAREIGADEADFMQAFREIPSMAQEQFQKIAKVLFTMAGQLSAMAYQNAQQARMISERMKAEKALNESEERFRTTLYSIGDGVITTDTKGRLSLMNQVAEQLTGWSHADAAGKALEEVFPIINEATRAEVEIPIRKVLREGTIVGLANHTLLLAKDGTERPIADSGAPIRNEQGEIVGVVLVFRDQTEERKAENLLRESEERFRSIIESSPIGKYIYQLQEEDQLIFMGANPSADRIIGIDHHPLKGKTIQEAFPNLVQTGVPEVYTRIAKGEMGTQSFEMEYAQNQINGVFQVTVFRIENNSIAVNFVDISDRKKTESALQESEFFFRESQRAANIGSYKFDLLTGFWHSSEVLDLIFGIGKDYVRNVEGWKDLIYPDDLVMMNQHLNDDVIGQKKPFSREYRIVRKSDGKIRWVNGLGQLHFNTEGNIVSLIGTIADITQRKESEESLRRNEQKFRALIENSSDAISLVDSNGIEFYHSFSYQHILGYSAEERNGKSMMELIHPDDRDTLMKIYSDILENPGIATLSPARIQHNNGSWIWIEGVANNLLADPDVQAIVINFRDITERKQFELKLQSSERELKKAQQISHIGSWHLDLATNEVYWTDELYRMYGFDPNLPVPHYTEHMKLFTPESWELLSTSLANTAETGIPYELELKTVREDGRNGWLWVRGETVMDVAGKTVGLWGAAQDISERKHAEQLLRESEEKFRTLVASSSDGISLIDLQGNILFVNQRKVEMVKANSAADLLGINAYTLLSPFHQETMRGLAEQFITDGYLRNIEVEVKCFDGSTYWAEMNFTLVCDLQGNPSYIMDSVRDISERKATLAAIQNERQLLRTLIDHLPDPIYIKDHEGCKIVANRADVENIGASDEREVLGKSDLELFNGDVGYRGYEDDLCVLESGEPVINREEVFHDKEGTKRWLLTSKIPLTDQHGKVAGLVGIGRDITEQKRANETIQKLTKSIEQSPSTIVITDIYGAIEYVNPKFCEITGYSKEEALGQNPRILKSGEMPADRYLQMWETISSGEVWRGEFRNRKKNGDLYWEWATMTSIKNDLGVITNYIAIKEDISLRKQMEAELIVAKEKAEESDRLKSAFLANMSHEIRTPLNSIIGFSELLADSDFETEQKEEFVRHIITNGNNLLLIISDIMDISKMESKELKIYPRQVHAQKFVSSIQNQFSIQLDGKAIDFKLNLPAEPDDLVVLADPDRLQQVFNNLLSNALKFTCEGCIEIGCESSGKMVQFHVKDTGIGIPVQYHEKIFERFRQVDEGSTRTYGGNGLGLAITRNLIELMGGIIRLESKPGKGSTFYFTLPKTR